METFAGAAPIHATTANQQFYATTAPFAAEQAKCQTLHDGQNDKQENPPGKCCKNNRKLTRLCRLFNDSLAF
jgi:hypothetical protein